MKTEIRFLLDLVLEHKLPPEAKKLCLERIGEVETSLQRTTVPHFNPSTLPAKSIAQLKYEQESGAAIGQAIGAPIVNVAAAPLAPPITNRVVGGEINTGGGTRGPRKF